MNELKVSGIYTYPIKSCSGVSLTSARIENRGLVHDRRWMLIDQNNRFISQRELAGLSAVKITIHDHSLEASINKYKLVIPFFTPEEIKYNTIEKVTIWDDVCDAILYDDIINHWFSTKLGKICRLAYMPDDTHRLVDPHYAPAGQITTFSDGYPILILGQSSLDHLNEKLVTPILINRFRPNIVFTGGKPHIEDEFRKLKINDVLLECVKLSRRCNVPNIDQETSIPSDEPTKTLAQYRLIDKKILFGNNTLVYQTGTLSIGDPIQIE